MIAPGLFHSLPAPVSHGLARLARDGYTDALLGRRQVVRQRLLVPPFAGSNPAAPAILPVLACTNTSVDGAWRLCEVFMRGRIIPEGAAFPLKRRFETPLKYLYVVMLMPKRKCCRFYGYRR